MTGNTNRRTPADDKARYHHGALRDALMEAAERELTEKGIEGFSLRGVAKRAGVSHAAPAHHFRDTGALLTALAAVGFRRFVAVQTARQARAEPDPLDQLVAAGLGYVEFAMANPALFRLMFSSRHPDHRDPALSAAAGAAFDHLADGVARLRGTDPYDDPSAMLDVNAAWAMVHGLGDLLNAGRLRHLQAMSKTKREAAIAEMIRRSLGAVDDVRNSAG